MGSIAVANELDYSASSIQSEISVENDLNIKNDIDLDRRALVTPLTQNDIKFSKNKNLNKDQIEERFQGINATYNLNEPFSDEDAEFIRVYASPIQSEPGEISINGTASGTFSNSRSVYGVSATYSGSVFSTINYLNHSYGGNVTAKITAGNSKVKGMDLHITNVAYGLIGTSGTYIGIVYNGEITSSTSSNTSYSMNRTKNYSAALVVYTWTGAYVDIHTTSGDFDIHASKKVYSDY